MSLFFPYRSLLLSLSLVCSKNTVDFFFPALVWNFSPKLGMEAYTYTFLFHRFPWFLDVAFYWSFPSLFLTSSPPTPEHSYPHLDLEGSVDTAPSMRDRNQLTLCAVPPSPALHSLMVCFSFPCQESSIHPTPPTQMGSWPELNLWDSIKLLWGNAARQVFRAGRQAGMTGNLKAHRSCSHPLSPKSYTSSPCHS